MKKICFLFAGILAFYLTPPCLSGQALFTRVTNTATTFTNTAADYKGAAWIDLDGDNLPEIFASQRFLFHNDGNGQFSPMTDLNGAGGGQRASGSSWGDIDNDGHPDCITASLVSNLHHNNGDNTFSLQTASLPNLIDYSAWDCSLADADNDGRLDLLYVHARGFHATGPFPCKLFLQKSAGAFTPVTGYEFTDSLAPYTIPVWTDYDLDGDMDLFIGSGPGGTAGPDFCYKNLLKETNTFALQRLTSVPFDLLQDGQVYNFPDYDNDGDLDFCLTNYAGAKSRFYRNDNGAYTLISTPFNGTAAQNLSNAWGDVDNDGDLDALFSSDGTTTVRIYRNKGDGTFLPAKAAGVVTGNNVAGVALADYDNDGDLDFYTNGAGEGRAMFRNDSLASGRHWAQFTLEGAQSNRSALGATLRVKAVIGGKNVWQIRQVLARNSFQSQNDLRQHVGLNDATKVDSVEVRWPSGLTERFANLAADNFFKIVEGQGISVLTAVVEPAEKAVFQVSPNPAKGSFRVEALNETSPDIRSIQLFDSSGQVIPVQTVRLDNGVQVRVNAATAVQGVYYLRIIYENNTSATRQVTLF